MKRRVRDPDDSRERILQAAVELFSQRGYAGTGVDEVAARSGIAKTAIYYHFDNKDGLLAAVLERAASAWIDGIRQASSQGQNPAERLDRALTGMRAMLEEKGWILRLLQILALEVADEKPAIRGTLQSIFRRANAAIVDGMGEAAGGEIPGADQIGKVVLALLDGIALGQVIDPERIPIDQAFAELRRVWLLLAASYLIPEMLPNIEERLRAAGALLSTNQPSSPASDE
jgi:AcrR family transcriptional regulator